MSTETERRLRAALEASADLITEPAGRADYQPPTDIPDRDDHPNARRRPRRWMAPLLAAAAIVILAAAATVIVRTVNAHLGQPASHRSPSPTTSAPSPAPSPTTTPPTGQHPLAGPQVDDASLFVGGHGYARTQHALLWTDDLGATWRNITPPGLTAAQLQSAGIAVRADGHQWVAVAPTSGANVTMLRRSSTTGSWNSTSIPLGPLTVSPNAVVTMSLSFTDASDGWLLVGEQITHTGYGELLRTADGGATWTLQAGRSTLPADGTIHFLTDQVGYLEAETGDWWATRDAGQSWTRLQLPAPAAKKRDSITIAGAPTLGGNAVVVAASFTAPGAGTDDGVGIYRSTDGGHTWTVQQLASETATESYNFAASPDGLSYVLLRGQSVPGSQVFTWVTSRSTDDARTFTDTSSVHNFYPGPLTVADPDNLWSLGGASGCKSGKADCWNTAGLIASNNGGTTWHQLKLPS